MSILFYLLYYLIYYDYTNTQFIFYRFVTYLAPGERILGSNVNKELIHDSTRYKMNGVGQGC